MKDQELILCKLTKSYLEKHLERVMRMVDKPKFICKKCARGANEKQMLCKPKIIS